MDHKLPAIERLSRLVGSYGVEPDQLIDALYVLRAPRTLNGVVRAIRHLSELRGKYDGLNRCDWIDGYLSRLQVLDRVASYAEDVPEFNGDKLGAHIETQLRPDCGDSGICDALLLACTSSASRNQDFEKVVAWFVWNGMRFQSKYCTRNEYERYLAGEGDLSQDKNGHIIYYAWLGLRALTSYSKVHQLQALSSKLVIDESPSGSELQALLFRITGLKAQKDRLQYLEVARGAYQLKDDEIEREIESLTNILPKATARFLDAIWNGNHKSASRSFGINREYHGRQRIITDINRYGGVVEHFRQIDRGDAQIGFVRDLYRRVRPQSEKSIDVSAIDDDEEDEDPDLHDESCEPSVSLFMSNEGDILKSYYAARGLQSITEYTNALLPWPNWRLSTEAIDSICHLIEEDKPEKLIVKRARLAIGLSLITGRPLSETVNVLIAKEYLNLSAECRIGISIQNGYVRVIPASPNLTKPPALTSLCHPRGGDLSLPLPTPWISLAKACSQTNRREPKRITQKVHELLAGLPNHLGIKARALHRCLHIEIQQITRGDLGVMKVITDTHDANVQNIIHYSSYPDIKLMSIWRQAAERLVGPLPEIVIEPRGHVGSHHPMDVDKIRFQLAKIRDLFHERISANNWISAYNGLTLYTSLRVALATASRKTRFPIPSLMVNGHWAFVDDKSRSDGSTDRLIPLSKGVIEQVTAWRAMAEHLSLQYPELDPVENTGDALCLRMKYLDQEGQVTAFLPKIQEKNLKLSPLPANWARKLIRSMGGDLGASGRTIDTGCGHWVRGRHAWRFTSSMRTSEFESEWMNMQQQLEEALDFQLLAVNGIQRNRLNERPALPTIRPSPRIATPPADDVPQDVKLAMQQCDSRLFEMVFSQPSRATPDSAYALADATIQAHMNEHPGSAAIFAGEVCRAIRVHTRIPLFAERQRVIFAKDWMVQQADLKVLAWAESELLPRYRQELECLPAHQPLSSGSIVDLGRLIMLLVWRVGLARLSSLERFLIWLSGPEPVLATGPLRYVELTVPCRRGGEEMHRTVYLDSYVAAYVLVERRRIRHVLQERYSPIKRNRRADVLNRAFHAYARSLQIQGGLPSVNALMGAAGQYFMINTSPLLAGYARSEYVTHDLDDATLRRLSGFNPVRRIEAPDYRIRRKESEDPDDLYESTFLKQENEDDVQIPEDVLQSDGNVVAALVESSDLSRRDLIDAVQSVVPQGALERLIKGYALWLLERMTAEQLSTRDRERWRTRVTMVGHALLGLTELDPNSFTIEGWQIDRLAEQSEEHFSARTAHSAWNQFRHFIRDASADHAGCVFANLTPIRDNAISAHILRIDQEQRVADLLASARSGIGNARFRHSAQKLFLMAGQIGARRNEIEMLRHLDWQTNLIRIQPYTQHELKTAWSQRVIPTQILSHSIQNELTIAKNNRFMHLVDAAPDMQNKGEHYFDAINQAMKQVSQNPSLAVHHQRHTLASRLLLSMVLTGQELDDLEVPWIKALIVDPESVDVLLGNEGKQGHGLQAISAVLGHSHPTTTLRHYIHTVGIAFHAMVSRLDVPDMRRSFERRLSEATEATNLTNSETESGSSSVSEDLHISIRRSAPVLSTVRSWARKLSDQYSRVQGDRHRHRLIGIGILRELESRRNLRAGIHKDESPITMRSAQATHVESPAKSDDSSFVHYEMMDRCLRTGLIDPHLKVVIEQARIGLVRLSAIPSGRRGCSQPRHPLIKTEDETYLPLELRAHTATRAAIATITTLNNLKAVHPDDYLWIMNKWIYRSEKDRGRMKLDNEEEVMRAQSIVVKDGIEIAVEYSAVSRARAGRAKSVPRMRIVHSESGTYGRDIDAVRWAMTWLSAMHLYSV